MLKKFCVLIFVFIFPFMVLAQNYGKIMGKVIDDKTKAALPGVNVIVEGTTLGAATDLEGKYVILQVPPGYYNIRVDYMGYQSVRVEQLLVRANHIAYADFSLEPKVLDMEEVVVMGERPVIEKDITATVRSVTDQEMQNIPSTTVSDILQMQAGVVNRGGLHFRGGRTGEVTYFIDGVPLKDPLFSDISSSEVINREAIAEMQVISGTYSAEYGNSMSGIINITTKEGGSRIRGELNVKSSGVGLEQASTDYNRNVVRATVSGPLIFKQTNFFLSGNLDDRDNYLPWGFRKEQNIFAKITDRHFENFRITLSGNLSNGHRKSYSHSWKYIEDQYWYEPETSSRMAQLGITHTLAPNLYYTLSFYYNSYTYKTGDFDYRELSPAYQRDANKEFYLLSYVSTYEEDDQQTYGVKGDVLWQANNFNEIKAGFELRQNILDRFYINAPYYDDHILDNYIKRPREAAAYIQDKINFSSIILSAGLRFDLTDPNSDYWENPYDIEDSSRTTVKADIHTQFSPRLGISYPVSEKTVFHFGYGHYFQRPEYQFIYKTIARDNAEGLYDANKDGRIDYADNILMNLRSGNGRFGNPNLKPEKTITYEFGLSHQIMQDYLLNLSVYSKRITNYVGGRTFFAGDKPEYWETFSLHINEDFAYNNGVEVQFRKMRGQNIFGEINYRYAVDEGSSSGPLERVGVEEANRQTLKFFPLRSDQRHTVNAYLTFQFNENEGPKLGGIPILENLRTSVLFQYGSGFPYTKGTRGATEPYELYNERLPENWTFDLKVDREIELAGFRVIPYLEIYNLTNRKNVVYVDPYTGKPDFSFGRTYEYAADPENWGPPRIIYLGLTMKY
jgi:outer membrane receptor protein involved in Fe transport